MTPHSNLTAAQGGHAHPLLNAAQLAMLSAYAGGEFAHLSESIQTPEDFQLALESCGNGLLRFLLVELGANEGSVDVATAIARVEAAIDQLHDVRDALLDIEEQ